MAELYLAGMFVTNMKFKYTHDTLHIGRIIFPITSLGKGNRIGIWLQGCDLGCHNCMSKDLWYINEKSIMSIDTIIQHVIQFSEKCDGITISGGEPFLQIDNLMKLIIQLHDFVSNDIILFTGYYEAELKNMFNNQYNQIRDYVSLIIAGRYIEEKNNSIGLAGSCNQEYIICRDEYNIKELENYERSMNVFRINNSLITVGILNREE